MVAAEIIETAEKMADISVESSSVTLLYPELLFIFFLLERESFIGRYLSHCYHRGKLVPFCFDSLHMAVK